KRKATTGELIAIDDQYVYVGTRPEDWARSMGRIPRVLITEAYVNVHSRSEVVTLAIWTATGGAALWTHGIFVLFSAPIWVTTGASSAKSAHRAAWAQAQTDDQLSQLYQFARFPQGLPEGLPGRHIHRLEPESTRAERGGEAPRGAVLPP